MSVSRIFLFVVILSIVGAVVYAFFLMGSPIKQRALQFDRTRISDLQQLSSAINTYWESKGTLPESFGDIQDQQFIYIRSVTDPKTGEEYEYSILTQDTFELCAVFELDSKEQDVRTKKVPFSEEQWQHEVGRVCFERVVQASILPNRVPGALID